MSLTRENEVEGVRDGSYPKRTLGARPKRGNPVQQWRPQTRFSADPQWSSFWPGAARLAWPLARFICPGQLVPTRCHPLGRRTSSSQLWRNDGTAHPMLPETRGSLLILVSEDGAKRAFVSQAPPQNKIRHWLPFCGRGSMDLSVS